MEAVIEPTVCSTPSGIVARLKASGIALLRRSQRPLPDIMLYSQKSIV